MVHLQVGALRPELADGGERASLQKSYKIFFWRRGYGVGCGERVGRGSMARVSKTGRTSQPSLALTVTMKLIADRQCGTHLVRRRGEEVLKEKAGFYQEFCKFFSVGRRNDWLFQYFYIFLLFCVERFSRENVSTYGTQVITGVVRSLCSLFVPQHAQDVVSGACRTNIRI